MSDHSDPSEVARIERAFEFHPATDETGPQHDHVRQECKKLALWIERNVPPCDERGAAIQFVQQAMWASNAAVAIVSSQQAQIQKNLSDAMEAQ